MIESVFDFWSLFVGFILGNLVTLIIVSIYLIREHEEKDDEV